MEKNSRMAMPPIMNLPAGPVNTFCKEQDITHPFYSHSKKIRVSLVPFARKTNECLMDHRYQNSLRWVNECPLKNWKAIRWFYFSLSINTQLRVLHWIHFFFNLNMFWFRNFVSWSSRKAKCNFNIVTLASQLTYSRLSKTWQTSCWGFAEIVKET